MFIMILIAISLFSISIYSYQTNKDKAAIVSNPSAPASSSVSSACHSDTPSFFPYLTQKCIRENRVETVEAEIQAARKGTAEDMWRTLWNNENLGYVDVAYVDATKLYNDLVKWYGELPYKVRNFRDARNKR